MGLSLHRFNDDHHYCINCLMHHSLIYKPVTCNRIAKWAANARGEASLSIARRSSASGINRSPSINDRSNHHLGMEQDTRGRNLKSIRNDFPGPVARDTRDVSRGFTVIAANDEEEDESRSSRPWDLFCWENHDTRTAGFNLDRGRSRRKRRSRQQDRRKSVARLDSTST